MRVLLDRRGCRRLGALGLFALALAIHSTLAWFQSGHVVASHGSACSVPADARHGDSRSPDSDAPHDSRTCFQCQFYRNAAGAEAVTVADTDASAALLPERVLAPVYRAVEAPRHARPEPRAPPRLQAHTPTVSA